MQESPATISEQYPCTDEIGRMSASMLLPKAHAAPAASRRDIDIWLTYYDEIVDDRQLARLRSILSDDEVAQEGRFYFADDRKRYLVTRAMVRMVLSRYAQIAPEHWAFSKNAYGRPVIADAIVDAEAQAWGLSFNLSHTRGLIALAVTRGRELNRYREHRHTRHIARCGGAFFLPDRSRGALVRRPGQAAGSLLRILDFEGVLHQSTWYGPVTAAGPFQLRVSAPQCGEYQYRSRAAGPR